MPRVIRESAIDKVFKGKGSKTSFDGLTVERLKAEFVSIKEATVRLAFGYPQYTRRRLGEGRIEGLRLIIGRSTRVFVYLPSIVAYRKAVENRNKYRLLDLYLPESEIARFRKVLEENGFDFKAKLHYDKNRSRTTKEKAVTVDEFASIVVEN